MVRLNYTYCRESKPDEAKGFNIPKNENAPQHLRMTTKPPVYVADQAELKDLLLQCAVPVIDPLVLATLFIRFWPEEFDPEADWTSFGQVINRTNPDGSRAVSLGDLFVIKLSPKPKVEGVPVDPPTLMEVFFLTCMKFRLANYVGGEYAEYVNELKTRMTNLGKSPPFKIGGLQNLYRYDGVTDDENLQTIIAGLDMYLMKFPKSSYKLLRMGTIVMRLKDMGAWSALKSMYSYVGDDAMKEDTIFRWLFSAGIGEELQNLIEDTQETDQADSYYPYARAMNLIPASFAAVSNNPNLHLIVHIVGTLKGNMRSGNARHVGGAKEGAALKIALWITMGLDYASDHYMWFRNKDTYPLMKQWEENRRQDAEARLQEEARPPWEKEHWDDDSESHFGSEDGQEESVEEQGGLGPTPEEMRAANTPESFYQLGVQKEFILPANIYLMFQKRIKDVQFRQGTIGNWLKTILK